MYRREDGQLFSYSTLILISTEDFTWFSTTLVEYELVEYETERVQNDRIPFKLT